MRHLILTASLLLPTLAFASDALQINDPYARAVPPGQPNSAAFMELHNPNSHPLAVVSAHSPVAEVTELHTHTDVDGVMQMRQIEQIDVPAKSSAQLRPGGLHVMLIGLKQPLNEGDEISLTLTDSEAREYELSLPVRAYMPMPERHSHHGHH